MILAIDIGNTKIDMALVQGERLRNRVSVVNHASSRRLKDDLTLALERYARSSANIDAVMLCSVVPRSLKVVRAAVRATLRVDPLVIGTHVKVPIKNKYRHPKEVGQDRLVGAFAAQKLYGTPVLIIDFGTATTLDYISSQGYYEGGIILPGLLMSAESLSQKTAMLPKIQNVKGPKTLIGKTTEECILSGLFHGYGSMCKGLIELIIKQKKITPKVIVTGGYTRTMKKFIAQKIHKIDKDLVLKGIALLFQQARPKIR